MPAMASGQPTDRLFFAVFPDRVTALRIAKLAHQLRGIHGLKGRPLAADRYHVSLHHVGDYAGLPEGVVSAASRAASGAVMPRFAVAFDRAASFRGRPGNQPLVLRGDDGVIGLTMLQDAVGSALEMAGLGPRAPHYTPHLTLLYGDRFVADHPVEPVGWTVHEFVLVHSLLGRSRYLPLARFALGAQA